jgi:hypothetical protein
LKGGLQTGFSIIDRFAGDGSKQHPDIKAVFSGIHFIPRGLIPYSRNRVTPITYKL